MEGWTPAPEGIGESPRPSGRERWGLCVSEQVPTEGPWTQYRMPHYHGVPLKAIVYDAPQGPGRHSGSPGPRAEPGKPEVAGQEGRGAEEGPSGF